MDIIKSLLCSCQIDNQKQEQLETHIEKYRYVRNRKQREDIRTSNTKTNTLSGKNENTQRDRYSRIKQNQRMQQRPYSPINKLIGLY